MEEVNRNSLRASGQGNNSGGGDVADGDSQADAEVIPPRNPDITPVVGLGGSAGSIELLQQFFQNLPDDSGMAYVVVIHLSPEHESLMANILQRATRMPVLQVNDTVAIQPNEVYVISPGQQLSVDNGNLLTTDMSRAKGRHTTVDHFFRSLAESRGPEAIGVVLSGGDSDGAIGLKMIKEQGGLTIAQDPAEAEHQGMPLAAIATGMVDWILPVEEMAGKIIRFRQSGAKIQLPPEAPGGASPTVHPREERDEMALRDVLAFLKTKTGHEFGEYKRATVLRRIGRRMQVTETENLETYLAHLRTHPGECEALLQDLLISVTNFFRDKEAFDALETMIPDFFKGKTESDQVRVWVAGCATGEEAYSIAILLAEHASTLELPPQIQIFATDLDQAAINVAREGRYPEIISADVSDPRLGQFFTKEGDHYRVRRALRDTILFARHDLLKDSPFSRLDLVSCRNLLIYLNRDAQSKVFDTFHFALRPEGCLFLGTSESADEASALFSPIDKKNRLFSRRVVPRVGLSVPAGAATMMFAFHQNPKASMVGSPTVPPHLHGLIHAPLSRSQQAERRTWSELHYKLIETIAPPSLVLSKDYQIMHLSPSAGKFLQFSGGEPTMNLLNVIHPDLKTELRAGLFRAGKSKEPVEIPTVPLELEGIGRLVDISISPVGDMAPDFLLVLFRERDALLRDGEDSVESSDRPANRDVVRHLEEELDQMRFGWRETVEQYEASVEELKASNEELQAMNEELRSATEELETGREELHSINEEVITINQELKNRVEELSRANSDLQNLMASSKIATIFIDREMRIKRFTPATTELFNLIPTDFGRPLSDITHRLKYPEISTDARRVLKHLTEVEREVHDSRGHSFLTRMLPYRTSEEQIGGVIITCVDITDRKSADETRRWLSTVVESSIDAIFSFTMDGVIVSWNPGAERIFGYASEEIIGKSYEVLVPLAKQLDCGEIFGRLRQGEAIAPFDTVRLRKDGQLIDVSLSASVMKDETGEVLGGTAIARDIMVRKQAVEELKQARQELETRVEERTVELRKRIAQLAIMTSELTLTEQRERKRMAQILHDQLQQVLVAAKLRLEGWTPGDAWQNQEQISQMIALLDEALENSRSLAIDLSPPILCEGLGKALKWLCGTWMHEKYKLDVECEIDESIDTPQAGLRILLYLAVKELLFNVVKHSHVNQAVVELTVQATDRLRITVRDHGAGFDMDSLVGDSRSVTGLGLVGLNERIEMLGGKLEIRSKPEHGVEAVIIAPMKVQDHLISANPSFCDRGSAND
jgi:two-component system CheB/CheR fusion protein